MFFHSFDSIGSSALSSRSANYSRIVSRGDRGAIEERYPSRYTKPLRRGKGDKGDAIFKTGKFQLFGQNFDVLPFVAIEPRPWFSSNWKSQIILSSELALQA